jgi:hypothetical protein
MRCDGFLSIEFYKFGERSFQTVAPTICKALSLAPFVLALQARRKAAKLSWEKTCQDA